MNPESLNAALVIPPPARYLFLVPLLPLVAAAINGLFGRRLQDRFGKTPARAIGLGAMLLSLGVALYAFLGPLLHHKGGPRALLDVVFPMIRIGHLRADMAFLMDPLSGVMALVVLSVGALIHLYLTGKTAGFSAGLSLFVSSMLLLVLGDNFIVMFFGWAGVGLCGYSLIDFSYREKEGAGSRAFVVGRVGDWGLLIGLCLLFWGLGGTWTGDGYKSEITNPDPSELIGTPAVSPRTDTSVARYLGRYIPVGPTLSFRELRNQLAIADEAGHRPIVDGGGLVVTLQSGSDSRQQEIHFEGLANKQVWGVSLLFLVGLCFFIGIAGLCAQIPLLVWRRGMTAGPPRALVFFLVATTVTAGVYLAARLHVLFVR